MWRSGGISLAAVVLFLAVAGPVEARAYSNSVGHYRFTVPDDWTQTTIAEVDVAFLSPTVNSDGANLNALSLFASSARNTSGFLLQAAQQASTAVQGEFPGAQVLQAPRTFTTASGRAAADYLVTYLTRGVLMRIRQVLFASEEWDRVYALSFGAIAIGYGDHESVWSSVVNSFSVDPGGAMNPLLLVAIFGAISGTVAVALVILLQRRKAAPLPLAYPPGSYLPGTYPPGAYPFPLPQVPPSMPTTQPPPPSPPAP